MKMLFKLLCCLPLAAYSSAQAGEVVHMTAIEPSPALDGDTVTFYGTVTQDGAQEGDQVDFYYPEPSDELSELPGPKVICSTTLDADKNAVCSVDTHADPAAMRVGENVNIQAFYADRQQNSHLSNVVQHSFLKEIYSSIKFISPAPGKEPTPVMAETPIDVIVGVQAAEGRPNPKGTIAFEEKDPKGEKNPRELCSEQSLDAQLQAKCTLTLKANELGAHVLVATYKPAPEEDYVTSSATLTIHVQQKSSITLSILPDKPKVSDEVTLQAVVKGHKPTGKVTFKIGDKVYKEATLAPSKDDENTASAEYISKNELPGGQQKVTASYAGDDSNAPSTASKDILFQKDAAGSPDDSGDQDKDPKGGCGCSSSVSVDTSLGALMMGTLGYSMLRRKRRVS